MVYNQDPKNCTLTSPAAMLDTSNPHALHYLSPERPGLPALALHVQGGIRMTGLDRLRVSLKAERAAEPNEAAGPYVVPVRGTIDLYLASQVSKYADRLAVAFDAERAAVARLMAELTDALEAYRLAKIEGKQKGPQPYQMSAAEKKTARAYLSKSNLLARTGKDIGRSGVVGEETNRLLMFLAFTSRLRARPLQVVTLAASGTGKTYLQDAVGRLIPPEERLEVTTLTEQSLFHLEENELRHKLLLIEDLDGAAEYAAFALRELQTKGKLTKLMPMKNDAGQLATQAHTVNGPVCAAGCTTRERLYADNAGRVLLLHLDGSAEQDRAIVKYQKDVSAGLVNQTEQAELRRLFQNVQRLLFACSVRNPYAPKLALPPGIQQERRANQMYLDVIEAITFYHQQQRKMQTDRATGERFIESTIEDIEAANALMLDVLTTKADELTGACRAFLEELKAWLQQRERRSFSTAEARRALGGSPSAVKRHVLTLREYGLCEIIGGNAQRGGYEYALTAAGREGSGREAIRAFLAGRVERLKAADKRDK